VKYKVKFPSQSIAKKFEKSLKKIPSKKAQNTVMAKVLDLANNPRPLGEPKIKPPIEVYSYTAQYRIRIGDYRVLYDVDDKTKTIWIMVLRKRNERTY